MQNKDERGRTGSTRRAFLSASAVTAVAAPFVTGTALAGTAPSLVRQEPSEDLRAMLRNVDPARIKATVLRLTQFGTRHTASSQTDPVRGIGAATAWVYDQMQAAAATSGGRMTVQSELGQGTTIAMFLPRTSARPAPPAQPRAPVAIRSLDILCVEDNPQVADVAAGLLEQMGHGVRMAYSAAAAARMLEEGVRPDLVFSDIVMAGEMDGLALARHIRQKWPEVPVLLATGYSREAEAIGDEFPILTKPYQAAELSIAVSAACDPAG